MALAKAVTFAGLCQADGDSATPQGLLNEPSWGSPVGAEFRNDIVPQSWGINVPDF